MHLIIEKIDTAQSAGLVIVRLISRISGLNGTFSGCTIGAILTECISSLMQGSTLALLSTDLKQEDIFPTAGPYLDQRKWLNPWSHREENSS